MESAKRVFWRRLVDEWRSGQASARTVAERHGVNASTLSWWGQLFRDEERANPPTDTALATRSSRQPQFVEVTALLAPQRPCASSPAASVLSGVEVLVGGRIVRLSTGFDAGTLTRALDVLEGRP